MCNRNKDDRSFEPLGEGEAGNGSQPAKLVYVSKVDFVFSHDCNDNNELLHPPQMSIQPKSAPQWRHSDDSNDR